MNEIYKKLLNKKVKIFMKNDFKYQGILLEFDDTFLMLDDERDGISYLAVSEIKRIVEVRG